jgi:hypothetical protein
MAVHRLYVGTIGEGLWRSSDGGGTFVRACDGMFVECHVRALAVHPHDDRVLYLGNEHGVYRSGDGAGNWTRLDLPMAGLPIWSILLTPADLDLVLVGACPARLFRSGDGGRTWTEPLARMQPGCPRIIHTRVTALCAHPANPETFWAGVEIDGVYRSADGGRTWLPAPRATEGPAVTPGSTAPARPSRPSPAKYGPRPQPPTPDRPPANRRRAVALQYPLKGLLGTIRRLRPWPA